METTETKPKKVSELFSVPGRWTQGVYARATDGRPVDPKHSKACKWCPVGAIVLVYGDSPSGFAPYFDRIFERVRESTHAWNDKQGRTQEEVRALCAKLGI